MPRASRPTQSHVPLRAIEALLLWEGAASNERVRDVLNIHTSNASRWMAEYAALNPQGLTYSTVQKRYVADDTFRALLTDGRIEDYLPLARGDEGANRPNLVSTHFDFSEVRPEAFSILNRAAREGLAVTAKHSSMRNPQPTRKTLFPHALVEAGRRWHVRAYVTEADCFQDLALTRLTGMRLQDAARPDEANPEKDLAWTTWVDMRILPHPDLTPEQKQMVRNEYFSGTMARRQSVRAALLPYVVHELRAAVNPMKQRPPNYQLCIDKAEKLSDWLMPRSF